MKNTRLQIKPKILVILGPTASGKSALAVNIAKKYNGEIISADSRQVYIGLDIGTGKITKKEMMAIPHYMLDVVSPKKVFSVSDWKKQTERIIKDILARGKLPIICGGTGFYIQSIVEGIILPEVSANKKLRKTLERESLSELLNTLIRLDPKKAKEIDTKNPVRLIRAIEIATALGSVPKIKKNEAYDVLQIGLKIEDNDLKRRINKRITSRLKSGMIQEVKSLHKQGLSWKRMNELGLEYKLLATYIQEKTTKKELIKNLNNEIWHYAKRQMTWFKRDKNIKWYSPISKKINSEIKDFLSV
ncbi:tRNA (adenosine(37)-N6)-dimethylallyltransferase MiaA [Patescibacteria group bacterium]|nr:tRNA (adenosine(37)-N6)-dimethylallyltransferase MiaA [Patescibacteria group bacterium]